MDKETEEKAKEKEIKTSLKGIKDTRDCCLGETEAIKLIKGMARVYQLTTEEQREWYNRYRANDLD